MVAAGAVVGAGTHIPAGQIWGGNPARFLRQLKSEESVYLTGAGGRACWGRRRLAQSPRAGRLAPRPSDGTSPAAPSVELADHYVGVSAEHIKENSVSLEDIARRKGLAA